MLFPVLSVPPSHLIVFLSRKGGFLFLQVQSIRGVVDRLTNGYSYSPSLLSSSSQDYLWLYLWLPSRELLQCAIRVLLSDFRAALSKHISGRSPLGPRSSTIMPSPFHLREFFWNSLLFEGPVPISLSWEKSIPMTLAGIDYLALSLYCHLIENSQISGCSPPSEVCFSPIYSPNNSEHFRAFHSELPFELFINHTRKFTILHDSCTFINQNVTIQCN